MKDSCSSVSKLLEKYFDREATEKERSSVESHLPGCPACQDTLKRMEKFRDWMKIPMEEALQEDDFEQVWQKIHRNIRSKKETFWREYLRSWLDFSQLFQKRVLIPVAATAILVFVTTSLLLKEPPFYTDLSVVEYVESQDCNVMVYESEKPRVTVIWLFEEPEQGESSS
jgi:predicted anti-sigma-YlaC factor YlaD